MRMKKTRRLALLLLAMAALLCGCSASPPESVIRSNPDGQALVSADTGNLTPDALNAALYFRYGDTGFLAPEQRQISVQRDESPESALVQALLDGPRSGIAALTALFPPGTRLVSAARQGDTLLITFSEEFLGRYGDEPMDISAEPWRTEGPLRRRLCLDSLAATLTEAGLCAQVQVMVYRGQDQTAPMRLQAGFLDRSGDETILPPLTRNEERLLTCHNAADLLLSAWVNRDFAGLYDLTARGSGASARPVETSALDAFSDAVILTGYELSPGSVSLDGQIAVLCADLRLLTAGVEQTVPGYPLRLIREGSLWKMNYETLVKMLCQE